VAAVKQRQEVRGQRGHGSCVVAARALDEAPSNCCSRDHNPMLHDRCCCCCCQRSQPLLHRR
jgi:hypothetical protein